MSTNPNYRSDGALLLEGLARALEVTPNDDLSSDWKERKADLIDGLREAAADTWAKTNTARQHFEAAKAFAATEYRNEILISFFGQDDAVKILKK